MSFEMNMTQSCCQPNKKGRPAGLVSGILYGLLPHTVCIAFVFFSILGATAATTIFKKLLTVPYFFQILVAISFLFATISAVIYLKRNNNFSRIGIGENKTYLLILYGTTLGINLLLFLVVFPLAANFDNKKIVVSSGLSSINLMVNIPCSGHAPLIIDELKKTSGIENVVFKLPNIFAVSFDQKQISLEQIQNLEIFKNFPAKEVSKS